jgi:hypothetical protein
LYVFLRRLRGRTLTIFVHLRRFPARSPY